MVATRFITMHQNKGKSVAKSLSDRTDCAKNGEKTENGQFISSYACQAESVDEEFMLSKREYERLTGRHPNEECEHLSLYRKHESRSQGSRIRGVDRQQISDIGCVFA